MPSPPATLPMMVSDEAALTYGGGSHAQPSATLPMMVSDEAELTYGGGSHAQPSRHPPDDGV